MSDESNFLDSALAPGRETPVEQGRRDGWTPFARKLFLQVMSETGRVKLACDTCRLSTQSAYALRNRDPVFAASWDAACELARTPLADALYERAIEGFEESISRDGQTVATRHKFDSRLSIAVLHRLDKRCDRAEEAGARHLPLLRNWNEWLELVGNGEDERARTLLESGPGRTSRHRQLRQLLLGEIPIGEDESGGDESAESPFEAWRDEECGWRTNFPPPDGFDGFEQGRWGDWGYERDCTEEEGDLLEAAERAGDADRLAEATADRDAYFAELKAELSGDQ